MIVPLSYIDLSAAFGKYLMLASMRKYELNAGIKLKDSIDISLESAAKELIKTVEKDLSMIYEKPNKS